MPRGGTTGTDVSSTWCARRRFRGAWRSRHCSREHRSSLGIVDSVDGVRALDKIHSRAVRTGSDAMDDAENPPRRFRRWTVPTNAFRVIGQLASGRRDRRTDTRHCGGFSHGETINARSRHQGARAVNNHPVILTTLYTRTFPITFV